MLDHQAHQRGERDAQHRGDPERLPMVDGQGVGDRGAEHEHRAVREVQDVEDSKDERVAHREQRVDGPDEDRVDDLLVHQAVRAVTAIR